MYLIESTNSHDHKCSLQKPGRPTTGVSNVGQASKYLVKKDLVKTNTQTKQNGFSKPNACKAASEELKPEASDLYVTVPDVASRTPRSLMVWDSLSYDLPK